MTFLLDNDCAEVEGLPPYRPHILAKNERNQALFADYQRALAPAELAEKYGLKRSYVKTLIYRHGVKLPADEKTRRRRLPPPGSGGRRKVWPDCPPELRRVYMKLRNNGIPAAEARRTLDPGMQV